MQQTHQGVFSNGITIDFKALIGEILDKILYIMAGSIFLAGITFILCSTVIHLDYASTTKIYVTPQSNDISTQYVSLETSSLLTTDYVEIFSTRDIIEDAIMHFNLDETYKSFVKKVKVENPTDTRILVITVENDDPYLSRELAIYIREKAIDVMEKKMSAKGISVIEEANLPEKPEFPALVLAVLAGLVTAILIGGVVVFRFIFSDIIVTVDDIEKYLGVDVIGTINYEFKKKDKKAAKNPTMSERKNAEKKDKSAKPENNRRGNKS